MTGRRRGFLLALAGAGLLLGVARAPAAIDLAPWRQDIQFVTAKIAQHRYRLAKSTAGAEELGRLEAELARLQELLAGMTRLVEDIAATDSRVHSLAVLELDPKFREITRLQQYYDQLLQALATQIDESQRQILLFNARSDDNKPAAEADALNARDDRLRAEFKRTYNEKLREVERAIQAHARAQRDSAGKMTLSVQLTQQLGNLKEEYSLVRGPLGHHLEELDNILPLTAFSQGVPPAEAGLTARPVPPVGPGTNTRAIDQLRVITSSSRSAAGRDANDDRSGPLPGLPVAATQGGYGFDDRNDMDPADLPAVRVPEPVPLVLPEPPSARPTAPPEVRENVRLQQTEQRQADRVEQLGRLYTARRELFQKGPAATPAEWREVDQAITTTQAGIMMDEVEKRLVGGSEEMEMDLDWTDKKQTTKPLSEPPPPDQPQPNTPDPVKP